MSWKVHLNLAKHISSCGALSRGGASIPVTNLIGSSSPTGQDRLVPTRLGCVPKYALAREMELLLEGYGHSWMCVCVCRGEEGNLMKYLESVGEQGAIYTEVGIGRKWDIAAQWAGKDNYYRGDIGNLH